ncbi:MAG TPA: 3-methyl-2-oxobutanoate dehydrogenase subunit beta [Candidatus Omnitrophica bacterium]|nr:3-methyl-2-oxobutanoate dehydrogenase subunit beta [Candidatus Omnitrophota bacterium]
MKKKILMSGNEAMGEAAIAAGCRFYAGYPITPQNELTAYMAQELPRRGGIFIQSESELAAINMVFGASASGVRSMTSSSSPGISLKQEGISYISGAQLPAVIINVMRAGPGLGNIWPAQSDYFQATKGGGHGDYRLIVLAPASVQESYDLTMLAFSLSDRYRIASMILSDGLLGQMMEPLELCDPDRPVEKIDKPWALTGASGRKPNIVQSLYIRLGDVEKHNLALQKNYRRIASKEVRFEGKFLDDAKLVVVAYGSMSRIAGAVVEELRKQGKKIGLFRPVTLWPFPTEELEELSKKVKKFLAIEMSYGQMVEDVRLAVGKGVKVDFYGRSGGGVPTEKQIEREILKALNSKR